MITSFLKMVGADRTYPQVSNDNPLPVSGAVEVASSEEAPLTTAMAPDAANARLLSGYVTLPAVANTVRVVAIPDWARGMILEAVANPARFAIGEDPVTIADATTAVGTTEVDLAADIGAHLKKDTQVARLLAAGADRELRLRSPTASLVVNVEFFG